MPATPLLTYERCESSESVVRATAAVVGAHADRTERDHALRQTVLHAVRPLNDVTSHVWCGTVDGDDRQSRQGLMDLTDVPPPRDVTVLTCGPLPFMRHVRAG